MATQPAQPQAMAVTTCEYGWLAQGETVRLRIMGFVNPNPLLRMIVATSAHNWI